MSDFAGQLIALDKSKYKAATEHAFIQKAGDGTLDSESMRKWLGQDRLFVKAYLNFMGGMLHTIPDASSSSSKLDADLIEEALLVLGDACGNAAREVRFFSDMASSYNLPQVETMHSETPNKATAAYIALMVRLVEESQGNTESWIVAWVALWAMEIVYMNAWTFAKEVSQKHGADKWSGMIANWTSPEFKQFVDNIKTIMEKFVQSHPKAKASAEKVWKEILDHEVQFFNSGYSS